MTLFKRDVRTNTKLSDLFRNAGWLTLVVNFGTLLVYFYTAFSKSTIITRCLGSTAISAVMLGMEYAAMSVLFEPEMLASFLGEMNHESVASSNIAKIGMLAVSVLAAAVYYYDWKINVESFKINNMTPEYIVLGFVLVIMSELFFWIANILEQSALSNKRRRDRLP